MSGNISVNVAGQPCQVSFFTFQELVNARLKGKVTITYLGGPEVVPPNQQVQALKNGVVDVVLGAAAYYRTEVPMGAAVQFSNKLPSESLFQFRYEPGAT